MKRLQMSCELLLKKKRTLLWYNVGRCVDYFQLFCLDFNIYINNITFFFHYHFLTSNEFLLTDESDDSDIEEVQLIEEPIEEIIIPDDANDLDEPNLETLNAEEILAVKQEIERSPSPHTPAVEEVDDNEDNADDIVHITHSTNTVSIDGNVELGDSYQALSGPTKIKINIAKNHLEDKGASPKTDEPKKPEEEVLEEIIDVNEQPPPPGEEVLCSLEAADIKPRLKGVTLTVYPPVVKGTETSGLCTIM